MGPQTQAHSTVGIRTNPDYRVAELSDVDVTTVKAPEVNDENYTRTIDAIGYDWKTLNHETFKYTIKENLAYFITAASDMDNQTKIYKIVMKEFEGSATGNMKLDISQAPVSVQYTFSNQDVNLYPSVTNPNSTVTISTTDNLNISSLSIYDISGNMISSKSVNPADNNIDFYVNNLASGSYLVALNTKSGIIVKKLIVN